MAAPPDRFTDELIEPIMVQLEGGSFQMGDDTGRDDEKPEHHVTVSAFMIAMYPVSNAEYAVFLRRTDHPTPKQWGQAPFDRPDRPVCGVSWLDAVAYADWLTAETGTRYHLPTEAQREFAARGGESGLTYPWGNDPLPLEGPFTRGAGLPEFRGPLQLGTPDYPGANGFGLFHMMDNVHEWTADYYDPDYYQSSPHPQVDPRGPLTPRPRRAARGGSWRHDIKFTTNAQRSSLAEDKQFTDFGFRLAASKGFEYIR